MRRILMFGVLLLAASTAVAGIFYERPRFGHFQFHHPRQAPKPSAPRPAPQPGPPPTVYDALPVQAHNHLVLVEEDKPDVPSVWGIIEAASHEGWYGVQVHSKMCAPYGPSNVPNETNIVAQGPKELKRGLFLSPGTGVFVRHDHKTGRWHIMFHADRVERTWPNASLIMPAQKSPRAEDAEPLPEPGPAPAVPPAPK